MDTKEIRFKNLELLIREFGSAATVARKAGTSPAYISQILTRTLTPKGEERGVGPTLARKLEEGCGKPRGWMDQIQHNADRQKYYDLIDSLNDDQLKIFDRLIALSRQGWDWVDIAVRLAQQKDKERPKAEVHKLER